MIKYGDTVTLVKTREDGYGKEIVDTVEDVPAVVEMNTGLAHAANQDAITSDATVYPDPSNAYVLANLKILEEMTVIIPLFGRTEGEQWFKVDSADIVRDHQLGNQIDNIRLSLTKTRELLGVS